MELSTILMFVIASLSINLIPGPDVVYIVSNTMKGKLKSGIAASLGLGAGYLVHTLAAVFGLSALILSSAFLFSVVKYLGAAYLLYLGITSLINCYKGQSKLVANNDTESRVTSVRNVFTQGVVVSVLNPKVAMFYLAFLPQFIDISSQSATKELMILGLLFSALATGCNLVYSFLGSILFSSPKAAKYSRGIEGGSGLILVGLSAKIALSESQ
ncbi:LysE family translocator [Shewanella psychropiezotolerans]|uniref:LysE family translocator n=1 Tax=Shewanella psychropiezotolerans TaxID=2593655 RepID=A0ABX5X2Z0_9GAMM|nr:LysE family translocator [Shewanella psychropiezotolerans]QDO85561.1 LysE family translocator [Shewanella psychropiezotolerans]